MVNSSGGRAVVRVHFLPGMMTWPEKPKSDWCWWLCWPAALACCSTNGCNTHKLLSRKPQKVPQQKSVLTISRLRFSSLPATQYLRHPVLRASQPRRFHRAWRTNCSISKTILSHLLRLTRSRLQEVSRACRQTSMIWRFQRKHLPLQWRLPRQNRRLSMLILSQTWTCLPIRLRDQSYWITRQHLPRPQQVEIPRRPWRPTPSPWIFQI